MDVDLQNALQNKFCIEYNDISINLKMQRVI